ncbi:uncharacterized protein LOC111021983 [Momordica charantia]|uniref:Uncharacterized protein LOC111021983 n=1 Tax=Momordica charantia TaxID=3673 RepID=A0A6J1DMQ9_MOMCH|nr:uncharacterized protein LOC111021983 [Momordica charantia]
MKILSWNVRGINGYKKRLKVKKTIMKSNPDVVLLQETKLQQIDRIIIKSLWSSKDVGWACLNSKDYRNRKRLWSELRDISGFSEKFWCLGGDFNVSRWPSDKSSGGRITRSMRKFNCIIGELDLTEVPLSNGKFTWSRMGNDSIHSLLDKFLLSKEWDNLFNNSRVSRVERITSDHFPIVLDVGDCTWGPSLFRFFNSWLKNK